MDVAGVAIESDGEEETIASAPDFAVLAQRARVGDRDAFWILVTSHYDDIYRIAYQRTGDAADAEDIAQDVCVKLATAISGFDGRSRFRTWLFKIVITTTCDYFRKKSGLRKRAAALALVSPTQQAPDQDSASDSASLWAAIRRLPERQCEAMVLVYGEGLSHGEAGRILGMSEKTVSWHVHEAKKKLRRMVDDGI